MSKRSFYPENQSFYIGEDFEEYARKVIFLEKTYELLHRTPDHKNFQLESLLPDFKFFDKKNGLNFMLNVNTELAYSTECMNGQDLISYIVTMM